MMLGALIACSAHTPLHLQPTVGKTFPRNSRTARYCYRALIPFHNANRCDNGHMLPDNMNLVNRSAQHMNAENQTEGQYEGASGLPGKRLAVTPREAFELLSIGRDTGYEAIRRGEIRSVKIGRRILVPIA